MSGNPRSLECFRKADGQGCWVYADIGIGFYIQQVNAEYGRLLLVAKYAQAIYQHRSKR